MTRPLLPDDPTVPHVPAEADLDRDAAVDPADLHRFADRLGEIARRAHASDRATLAGVAGDAARNVRAVVRQLRMSPLSRQDDKS